MASMTKTIEVVKLGPDLKIKEDMASVAVWAKISSNDSNGICIAGIQEGDTVEIQDISGICSFEKAKNIPMMSGIVSVVAGIMQDGSNYCDEEEMKSSQDAFKIQAKDIEDKMGTAVMHKRRDGFGQDPGTNDYAKDEGGIIVCMPKAGGAIYASSENQLKGGAKKNGRLPKYFSNSIKDKNSFFPCRNKGGKMSAKASQDGTLNLIAFDQKFEDNAGSYSVKLVITRKNEFITHKEAKSRFSDDNLI